LGLQKESRKAIIVNQGFGERKTLLKEKELSLN